ncbi:MAG: N-acetylmuramoyl-L-alanine amidase [Symploca sp. SIO1B1]|nr:N-acetylmuramoyl-L-alanine amidase [Symploca sp. SIO2D2]NER46504.1 N-acetylmuramoyl-L-alanine amidase [Symploca sp. SIO1A3]NER93929.1 N-acetylmuramoyl-L-alanine amidase [Symploca sp. SIO1B1]
MVRFRWLIVLFSILNVLVCASAAEAGRLLRWSFDGKDTLEFITDQGVQPQAQLLRERGEPIKVVIDLPGTLLGQATQRRRYRGLIREIRAGQFQRNMARIVIELAPGYTLDPQQVKFRGITASRWTVDLPEPQRISSPSSPPTRRTPQPNSNSSQRSSSSSSQRRSQNRTSSSTTQLESFQVSRNGFFIRTSGKKPQNIEVERSRNRRHIDIELEDTVLSDNLSEQDIEVNRYGVSEVEFEQIEKSPPVVRIRMNVERDSPDWDAAFNNELGLVIIPRAPISSLDDSASGRPTRPITNTRISQLATIESVELANNGTQLLIRSNQQVRATNQWNRGANAYQITIPSAQLADKFAGPQLNANSPLVGVRVLQQDPKTVVILVQPSTDTQIQELNQISDSLLALQLQQRQARRSLPPTSSIPVPQPERRTPPSNTLPRVPNSRIVVMLDPGHGGKDPGAIGIGGLREKDVVLPITLEVAALLEQQGVQALLTRSDDRFISLAGRVQMAERARSNLFVSIHANAISASRPDVNGFETYYHQLGRELAQTVHKNVLQSIEIGDRRVRQARFYVLRNTSMPSILVETGFVTGYLDAPKLRQPEHRSRMARAIAQGILQYIRRNY